MAQLTITVHDDHVPRILAAFNYQTGPIPAFMKSIILQWIKARVLDHEENVDSQEFRDSWVEPDVS